MLTAHNDVTIHYSCYCEPKMVYLHQPSLNNYDVIVVMLQYQRIFMSIEYSAIERIPVSGK